MWASALDQSSAEQDLAGQSRRCARRLERSAKVLAATGLLSGFHIAFGLLALVVTRGSLAPLVPIYPTHLLGSLTFGILAGTTRNDWIGVVRKTADAIVGSVAAGYSW